MRGAAQEAPSERAAAARAFVAFFGAHVVTHFRREEEAVFPLLVEADGEHRALLVQALLDHQRLHALADRLADELNADAVSSQLLSETGSLLESHVRLEERRLFPLVEQLAGERLDEVAPAHADSPVVDLTAGEDEGPLWGTASDDLNVTLLAWHPGSATPEHVNDERDVLVVCLAGSGTVQLCDTLHALAEGQMLIIEKGCPRRIEAGPRGLRYLSIHLRRPGMQIASRAAPE
jgi:quercetin dioxygenase-like cupin family protein/hemerythrin superfamily protein